jgi:hypothetical protein
MQDPVILIFPTIAYQLGMYNSLFRLDITYTVSVLSKFAHNPDLAHWNAVKRVFAYLAGTKDLNRDSPMDLEGSSILMRMDQCMNYLGNLPVRRRQSIGDHQYQRHAARTHRMIRFHIIRWIVVEGKIKLVYCPTEDMIADTLTKALPSPKVKHFAALALGLRKNCWNRQFIVPSNNRISTTLRVC